MYGRIHLVHTLTSVQVAPEVLDTYKLYKYDVSIRDAPR